MTAQVPVRRESMMYFLLEFSRRFINANGPLFGLSAPNSLQPIVA